MFKSSPMRLTCLRFSNLVVFRWYYFNHLSKPSALTTSDLRTVSRKYVAGSHPSSRHVLWDDFRAVGFEIEHKEDVIERGKASNKFLNKFRCYGVNSIDWRSYVDFFSSFQSDIIVCYFLLVRRRR